MFVIGVDLNEVERLIYYYCIRISISIIDDSFSTNPIEAISTQRRYIANEKSKP